MISFKVGDVVKIRSGGVAMTVKSVADFRVTTIWDVNGVVVESEFPNSCLSLFDISTKQKRELPCKICGIMIVARNKNRSLCSLKCRAKDHRSRVRKCKTMSKDGVLIIDIAKEFGHTVEVVKRWIEKSH